MTYIKLFIDYLEAIEPLGDAERGRLFTALLQYAKTGEAPQLGGFQSTHPLRGATERRTDDG